MPSVDTIRNVKIQGSSNGVDEATAALNKLTASIAAANDNLSKTKTVANENAEGFRITGEGALTAANHLRQAAEAAYAFSPAFRGVVNEMAVPVLKGTGTALEAVAAGIVVATNKAGTGLIALAGAAEKASPALTGYTSGIRSAGLALEAFSPTLGGVAGSIAASILKWVPLVGQIILVVDAIKMVGRAWQLGGEKLAEYVALNEKAVAANTTADFFQRITKAAEGAKLPVDALAEALKKLNDSTAGKLGGSSANNAIEKLQSYGNFQGNTGVGQLQNANGAEEKMKAIVALYDQAVLKGERLAALEAIRATLGDTIANKAAADSGYLDKMLASADAINKTDLVKSQDIQNAVELQNRYDAAVKILEQRWHPIQDLLTQAGIGMHQAWVGIVESIATAVDWATKLVGKLAEAPPWFQKQLDRGATAFMELTTTPESRAAAEKQYGISSDPADIASTDLQNRMDDIRRSDAMADARRRLAEGMNRKFDTSKPPKDSPADGPDASAYGRAEESLRKYIETTNAASKSVDEAAASQERLKAIAALTAAGMKDGLSREAATAKAEMSGLAQQAAAAADALAKAKVASSIDFGKKTAFLSQEDVQIATQLKGIYGNDVPKALASAEAAGIRLNDAFRQISSVIETNLTTGLTDIFDGTKSVGQGFSDMSKVVVRALEEMIIKMYVVQPIMRSLQGALGGGLSLGSLFGGGAAAGATSTGSAGVGALGGLYHTGGMVGSEPTSVRYIHPSYFDDAPRFHTGGIAGDEVPIIAKKGEGVFTPGQMAAMGGGGPINMVVNNNASPTMTVEATQVVDGRGNRSIQLTLDDATAAALSRPGSSTRKAMSSNFGARPAGVRR
ncbi:hypothetical protein [Tardiphaga sp.]|uniref:hypothetical protein n=1 Tax=Tardiphaga sp. TaxID=1926292 RepID=UPI002626258F|nr:hypothetical protein [Tardiphaga sp.]MDB5618470.1 hypothetical protein [Tardiphaga sp.]